MAMGSRPRRRLYFQQFPGSLPCQPFPQCFMPWPPLLPPPPPSTLPPYEDPAATLPFNHRHSSLVPTLPVVAASLVAAGVLAIVITFFLLRRRRRRRLALLDAAPPGADAPLDEDGGDGEEDIHHVWHIRTVGLDESTIGTITAWAYKADDGVLSASATDCAVCLSEFCDGELVRLLPNCGHAFHVSCIDTWLRSHVNCPLCRAPVVAPNSAASSGDSGTSTASSSSSSSDRASLPSPESTLNHTEPNSVVSAQVDSNRADDDGQRLDHDRGTMEEEMDGERSDLGGRSRTVAYPIARPHLPVSIDITEDGFQPIRRSASMGAIIGSLELEGLCEILGRKRSASEAEWNHRTRAKHSSRVASLRKEVERSSSGNSSERFFLSIRGRGRSSLLPL